MKRFTLPVAYTSYLVVTVKKPPILNGDPCQGICDTDLRVITLWRNPNKEAMLAALIHEFFHALFHELGREKLHEDEALVEGCAQPVTRLLLERPWL